MSAKEPDWDALWKVLGNLGAYQDASVRAQVASVIQRGSPTQISSFAGRLPQETRDFFVFAVVRTLLLVPQVTYATQSQCYLEGIILAHGIALLASRGLYVASLQEDSAAPLTELELRPFYAPESRSGTLTYLAPRLEQKRLLSHQEAADLRWLNKERNRAAHGAVFGELEPPNLRSSCVRAFQTAMGASQALLRFARASAAPEAS